MKRDGDKSNKRRIKAPRRVLVLSERELRGSNIYSPSHNSLSCRFMNASPASA